MEKSFWQSKTIIVGLIEIVVGILMWVQGIVVAGAPLTLSGLLKVILRLITESKVIMGKKKTV